MELRIKKTVRTIRERECGSCLVRSHELEERKATGLRREGSPFLREGKREQLVGFAQGIMVRGSSELHWERMFSFPQYIWKRAYCLCKDKISAGRH